VRFVCAHGPDPAGAGRKPWRGVCAEEYASERPYVGAAEVRFESSAADIELRAHAEDRRAQHARVLPAQRLAHGCAEVTVAPTADCARRDGYPRGSSRTAHGPREPQRPVRQGGSPVWVRADL
jgi:hypothetical protein